MSNKTLVNAKFKVKFDINNKISWKCIYGYLLMKPNHLIIKIDENQKSTEKIKINENSSLTNPLFVEKNDLFISYGLINKVTNINSVIRLEVLNPANIEMITIDIYDIMKPRIFTDKKLTLDEILNIENFILIKKIEISKHLIETLVLFFNNLKDTINNKSKSENQESKYNLSLAHSKKYYINTINDLKKTNKLKVDLKKKIINKEKSEAKTTINCTINGTFHNHTQTKSNRSNNILNDKKYAIENISIDNKVIIYLSFDSILYEIKKVSTKFLDSSIHLFFQILGLDNYRINFNKIQNHYVSKNLTMRNIEDRITTKSTKNKSVKNLDGQLQIIDLDINSSKCVDENNNKPILMKLVKNCDKLNTYLSNNDYYVIVDEKKEKNKYFNSENNVNDRDSKEVIHALENGKVNNLDSPHKSISVIEKANLRSTKFDTPKFKDINLSFKMISQNTDLEVMNLYLIELKKNIEEAKKNHQFKSPNEYVNIIENTSEFCHRKFFEISFEEYFNNIFCIDRDILGVMKIESIISYFYYIKALKNYLFTNENKIYYANIFFYDEL